MYAPWLASTLRKEGFDVLGVTEHPELLPTKDHELLAWAAAESRRIATENVRDFCVLINEAVHDGKMVSGVLLVNSRSVSRSEPKRVLAALRAWLTGPRRHLELVEWLAPAPDVEG
jgi:hypothetical protein